MMKHASRGRVTRERATWAGWLGCLGLMALLATGLAVAPGTGTAVAAESKPPPQSVSPEVGKKLKPAQEALQKNDFDTGLQLAREALALATKPYDKEMSLRMIAFACGKKQDYLAYAATVEQLNELDTVPVEEKN